MRVTKAIREFIEEQVRMKAEASPNLAALKQKADEAEKKFNDEIDALTTKFNAEVLYALKKYNLNTKQNPYTHIGYAYDRDLPEVIAYHKAKDELRDKERQTVLDIIVEMELGGTKAELMEKLNNLQF